MDNAKPTSIDQNKITITVSGLPEFSVENLNHNKEFIENIIGEYLNQSIKLFFNWNSEELLSAPTSNQPPKTTHDSTNADKVVEKIIEEFDGEILR